MGGLLSYSGLTTKIRAMQSQLIGLAELREIVELGSVAQVVAYLKEKPGYAKLWTDMDEMALNRLSIETLLRQSIYQNYTRIYRFSNPEQKKFLDLYFKRYEMMLMKNCLGHIFDRREVVLDLSGFEQFFAKHSKLNLARLTEVRNLGDFIECLRGTEYYTPLYQLYANGGEQLMVFDYGMALDQYYFAQIWKYKDKIFTGKDLKEITAAYGQKFDLLNLSWIYRSKKYYHMDPARIYSLLIPVTHRLKQDDMIALVEAQNMEEFATYLSRTYYGRIYQELTPEKLEEAYTELMSILLRKESSQNPHSVVVMYSYLFHKEHEVNRLTTAVECVRYGVSPEEAMEHIKRS